MRTTDRRCFFVLFVLAVCLTVPAVCAAGLQDYSTTYTIQLQDSGTALWNVEYRTPLSTDSDTAAFEQYAATLDSVYLPQIETLMQSSAAQAASATSRQMSVGNFSGTAITQTTPTGKFGIISISFAWTNFSVSSGTTLTTGDAFAGGLYLSKDTVLVIRYPAGYSLVSAEPDPDQEDSASLAWYGLRSFDTGKPSVVLEKSGFPLLPVVVAGIIIIVAAAGLLFYRRKKPEPDPAAVPSEPLEEPDDPPVSLSDADRIGLDEKILRQLKAGGGEQFQSELGRTLGIPKSTLSSALHDLHQRGIIVKVKKGRENLIRLDEKYR
ncbi:helix-turn-helix transcriptional regulator [Methanoregula sp. UBA64]|jgi:uncharacterized membrane protein|uniref:helix-turn-helix transcriptional regulator n=1 Tax=Methanoregula sp. UBA64 TaxID=1915554 RepID=UPI0025EF5B02|nr:MarR family transcriptional regulator [Methanoregula sp. UBA64]